MSQPPQRPPAVRSTVQPVATPSSQRARPPVVTSRVSAQTPTVQQQGAPRPPVVTSYAGGTSYATPAAPRRSTRTPSAGSEQTSMRPPIVQSTYGRTTTPQQQSGVKAPVVRSMTPRQAAYMAQTSPAMAQQQGMPPSQQQQMANGAYQHHHHTRSHPFPNPAPIQSQIVPQRAAATASPYGASTTRSAMPYKQIRSQAEADEALRAFRPFTAEDQKLVQTRKREIQRYEVYTTILEELSAEEQEVVNGLVAEALVDQKRTMYVLWCLRAQFGQAFSDQIRQAFSKAANATPTVSSAKNKGGKGTTPARPNKVAATTTAKRKAEEPKKQPANKKAKEENDKDVSVETVFDVTSGVDLVEEEEYMQSQRINVDDRHYEEETLFVDVQSLKRRVSTLLQPYLNMEMSRGAIELLARAIEERLTSLLERCISTSRSRVEVVVEDWIEKGMEMTPGIAKVKIERNVSRQLTLLSKAEKEANELFMKESAGSHDVMHLSARDGRGPTTGVATETVSNAPALPDDEKELAGKADVATTNARAAIATIDEVNARSRNRMANDTAMSAAGIAKKSWMTVDADFLARKQIQKREDMEKQLGDIADAAALSTIEPYYGAGQNAHRKRKDVVASRAITMQDLMFVLQHEATGRSYRVVGSAARTTRNGMGYRGWLRL